jgi:hypothetical protein
MKCSRNWRTLTARKSRDAVGKRSMTARGNGARRFEVHCSGVITDTIRRLHRRAWRQGRGKVVTRPTAVNSNAPSTFRGRDLSSWHGLPILRASVPTVFSRTLLGQGSYHAIPGGNKVGDRPSTGLSSADDQGAPASRCFVRDRICSDPALNMTPLRSIATTPPEPPESSAPVPTRAPLSLLAAALSLRFWSSRFGSDSFPCSAKNPPNERRSI